MKRKHKRTIVIGDIHGCRDELARLLEKIEYIPETDRCISVGDLVDRGPKSIDVIDFIINNDIEITIGNHDDKYIRYRRHERKKRQSENYKNPIHLKSEKAYIWNSLTKNHFDFLEKQPYIINVPKYNFIVVHAGILPNKPIEQQERKTCLSIRYICKKSFKQLHLGPNFTQPPNSVHWTELYEGTKDIIYGHDIQSTIEPVIRTNKNGGRTIGIDTGACFGGKLTGMIFSDKNPRGEFVQVQSNYSCKEYKLVQRK